MHAAGDPNFPGWADGVDSSVAANAAAIALRALSTDPRFTDARTPVAHNHPTADVTGFTAAVDARITAAAKTVGTITFGANYEADPTAGGIRLWKVGTTVYLEGSFRNKVIISTVATGQYAAATMPAGFIPLTSQWRACAVGQDAVGFGIGTWRVDPTTGTLTWQDSSTRTNAPIGSVHVAQSLMSWEI